MISSRSAIGLAFAATLLAGCASTSQKIPVPAPLELPAKPVASGEAAPVANQAAPTEMAQTPTPRVDMPSSVSVGLDSGETLPPLGSTPVSVNVQDLPVPVLANEVFGNILGLNVNIDPQVSALQELVTLNTAENLSPPELFRLTRQVLADYGVAVEVEGRLVNLRLAPKGGSVTPPLIVSGKALPSVPVSHRPVFQLVELEVVRSGDAVRWLNTLFGSELKVTDETARNAVLISGRPSQVKQAMDALRVFDRPLMRGRVSTRLEPAFLTAEELAARLTEVLNLQGYSTTRAAGTSSSVIVLPIASANSVIVFATSQETMDYAVSWARELDRPSQHAGTQSMFYYQVRNTKATDLAQVLNSSITSQQQAANAAANAAAAAAANASGGGNASRAAPAAARTPSTSGIMVDEPRNALIYQGDPAQWERLLTLIRQMDRAPRQVMIEVTVAEVTLNDDNEFGLSWFAKNGFGRFDGSIWKGTGSGGAPPGPSGGGLTYLLDVAGQNRMALTAFANDNRVSILSTPRLLVKSGSEANIDVGTEVPTVTMTTTSNQQSNGDTNLLQSIQYRKTGIILKIKPTVYSDDRIDLDISQEVSEALPLEGGETANSPSIFNRSLNTSLSLRDGGSVVMAGLISDRSTNTDSGIPFVKDVPVLGNLFKNKSVKKNRTELILLIVPYIVESDERASEVSRAVIDRFDLLDLERALGPEPAPVPPTPARLPPATLPRQ
ncbi:MAG TPA: type II secretion system protein GspD [Pseudoxanthomonas sp.]|nr:type II secretion system protein GspD [Pseudoxanthomonas sp.]